MPLMYPVKHVFRNWKLFTALLIGITLAATFCAAVGIKANLSAEEALDKQISNILTDIQFTARLNQTNLAMAYKNITGISGVKEVEMITRFSIPVSVASDNYSRPVYTQLTCFPSNSRIYSEWINKPVDGIPENYTYIVSDSQLAQKVKVGDNISAVLDFPTPKYYNTSSVYVNLTVAGYAVLTENGYNFISPYSTPITRSISGIQISSPQVFSVTSSGYRGDLMIISWENTLEKLWNSTLDSSTVNVAFSVNIDRKSLLSPWNVEASTQNINTIVNNIENEVLANYLTQGTVTNNLVGALSFFGITFAATLLSFVFIALPVFFIAWYLGSTVSDVSFNIRRREIGLLSTKGLSSGQIQRMFLSESVVVGLIAGLLGVVGGLILNQYYAGTVNLENLFTTQLFNPSIVIVTLIFSVILSFSAVFWPARKASKIPAVEALRDYMPSEVKSRFRILHWIAFLMGSYKIVVFALGINMSMVFSNLRFSGGNVFLGLLQGPVLLFDAAMTLVGPLLFFWGFVNLVIRDSSKFQTVATKISSVMGDLGALAAKNVRRNPARLAAVAFMIAFIIGYGVQVNGQIASQQDYEYRLVKYDAGADVTVSVVNASKAELILENIIANVSGIKNATIERSVQARVPGTAGSIKVETVDVDSWNIAAYYEPEWFTGSSVEQMLAEMKENNNTIILDRSVAKQLNKNLYDELAINFESCPRKLRIIGFFGPEPQDNSINPYSSRPNSNTYLYSNYYSYVPRDLFNMTIGSDAYQVENFNTNILIALKTGVNGTDVANQIRALDPTEIYGTNSFDRQWRENVQRNNLATFSTQQTLDIQGLGLIFAVISASVGTALVAIVSLKERSREATLMSVRGLSYRQLVWMFLTESIAIITFAVVLGIVVGAIIVYGSVASTNSVLSSYSLVTQRLVFPTDAFATIGTYVALIYACTIGAILVMTSQYVTKLEKMVRAR